MQTRQPLVNSANARPFFVALLILFILLGFLYAVTTPIFEASDELWHYPFVRHLADGNPLPVQDPDNVGPWKQEASQQPLYYALAAALTFWIDTSDMESVRWLNPHVDNGVLTPDGNGNLIIHQPGREAFPWQGTVLAIRLIRLASVLMGAGTLFFTWRIAQLVFPSRPGLALGAVAVNAFTPMFVFISGAVNNDNLAILLCSGALYLMVRPGDRRLKDSLFLGIVLGLAALTKTTALGLIPLALLAVVIASYKELLAIGWRGRLRWAAGHGLALLLPVLAISGWWYYRNVRLYGDWLGWNAFIQVLGQRSHPASLRQLWSERWGFSLSYWGLFGGVNVPMAEWIYRLLNALVGVAAVGVVVYLVRQVRRIYRQERQDWLHTAIRRLWPLALLGVWSVAVCLGLVRWATVTWSSQGRLIFPAISALSILLVTGLFAWLPRRSGELGAGLLGGFMLVVTALAPAVWIAPAYRPPAAPAAGQIAAIQHPVGVNFGGQMRLLGYDLAQTQVRPGGQLELTLYWQTLASMDRDWSVFVHLNDPVIHAPVAQRDRYPGQGLLSTRLLEPGQVLQDRVVINVPGTVYAPSQTQLVVGLYDFAGGSGERLKTEGGDDNIDLGSVQIIAPSDGPFPNPVRYNFGDQLALVGYRAEPRRLHPGETLTLTLFWQALEEMTTDYTAFTHVRDVEDPSNRIYGQHDQALPGGSSTWRPGQTMEAVYHLTLAPDTPPEVYEIEVGIYAQDPSGELFRLQLITEKGRPIDDFLILGKVRVD
jgi:4-amino-4-deoxy-L-arabinose transferase-like glycosyltransferase